MTLQQLLSAVALLAPLGEITIRCESWEWGIYSIVFRAYGYTVTRTFATTLDVERYIAQEEQGS